jgi:hypothetical protein
MVRIRVDIPSESRSVELDVGDRSVIEDVVAQIFESEGRKYDAIDGVAKGRGWIMRIKTRSAQGRWWSEQEIKDYQDRESLDT